MAQFGSAPGLGPGGRRFESCRLDHVGTDFAPFRFFLVENQSHAPSFLLFREKSRSVRLLVCKRTRDGSQSLPTFHDIVPSAQPKFPATTAFAGKSCKNTRTNKDCDFDTKSQSCFFAHKMFNNGIFTKRKVPL